MLIFVNSIKLFSKPHQKLTQLLSSQIPVSKIILLLPSCMFTLAPILSRKHFITLSTSLWLKQNYSQSDAGLVKQPNFLIFSISSSSSLTLSIWLKESLIPPLILINYNQSLSLKTLDCILTNILTIPLNSGIAQAMISGCFMYQLTMTQKSSTSILSIPARCCGTSVRRKNVTITSKTGKCPFRHPIFKENTSLIY